MDLISTANTIAASGKGILAADEGISTIKKRFDSIDVESTPENRRRYRDLLFSCSDTLKNYISGVILFEETVDQADDNHINFVTKISDQGSIVGIKLDRGTHPLGLAPGETITEGLDGLAARIRQYHNKGIHFAKWRSTLFIGDELPSRGAIAANSDALARYAALCQEGGLVPIVEPEVLMDGAHSIERCQEVTEQVLQQQFRALIEQGVLLEGMILKPSMVISGSQNDLTASPDEVAERTIACLTRSVPMAVPGICFLSGGQSEIEATRHLNLMNQLGRGRWHLSFSYGRALQASALKAWGGKREHTASAQAAFNHRARANSLAALGDWNENIG